MKNRAIAVTGCCGTVGKEIVRQLLMDNGQNISVIGIDNNESELFFEDQKYLTNKKISYYMADLRDEKTLTQLFKNIDIVFHTAALKHVVMCEKSPMEAVQTNIHGVQNVIEAARANGVEKVIFTSSDKAVNPTSVMGTSKLMGERLMTAANSNSNGNDTIFASTRFGNVLGSNGSVIPIFRNQIESGGPVTITDKDMTRFIMSISQAAKLVLDSAQMAKGGEVLITKMPVINIYDLAKVMIEKLCTQYGRQPSDVEIQYIGCKPGEKLYEELMSDEETRRAIELENYFSVLPAYRGIYRNIDYSYAGIINNEVTIPYNSSHEPKLSEAELGDFLLLNNLMELDYPQETGQRYWPGDKESETASHDKKDS